MTATNHVLTGALIGFSLHQSLIALPAALLSHFVLDSLPHYGDKNHTGDRFKVVLMTDMTVAVVILISLTVLHPTFWLLAVTCGIVAASPDLMWLPGWLRELRRQKSRQLNLIMRFHAGLQRLERQYYFPVEIIWFMGAVFLLGRFI